MQYQTCTTYRTSDIDVHKITDTELYEQIRTGNGKTGMYETARHIGKGNALYDQLKGLLPCYYPNVTFASNSRNTDNIDQLTGEIYCDLDQLDCPTVTVKEYLKQFPFIKSIWVSFGGTGLGFTVKCENLSKTNFATTYTSISRSIGYTLDPGARKLTQPNVISYDPDIYVNPNPTVYIAKDITENTVKEELCEAFKKEKKYSVPNFRLPQADDRLRFKTELESYNGLDYVFDINGRDFVEVYIPKNGIAKGTRTKSLLCITLKLRYNNPSFSFETIAHCVRSFNLSFCKPALSAMEIDKILVWCKMKNDAGEIAIKVKQRYLWFDPKCLLTKTEKLKIVGTMTGELKRFRTRTVIKEAINALYNDNEIITQKKLASYVGKTDRTIRKYWNEFKKDVDVANENIRTNQCK